MIIAIDGPAAAGKGTLARKLAERFNLAYLDTGALYRAVGLSLLRDGKNPEKSDDAVAAARNLDHLLLDDPDLRTEKTGRAASIVAANKDVRAVLLDYQRHFAAHPPAGKDGAVLDGRDIGTVICPDATVKLFINASNAVRARRRTLELQRKGIHIAEADVLADLLARDKRDSARDSAPLKPAQDAILLDTTKLDIEAAFARACAIVERHAAR